MLKQGVLHLACTGGVEFVYWHQLGSASAQGASMAPFATVFGSSEGWLHFPGAWHCPEGKSAKQLCLPADFSMGQQSQSS